MPEKQRPLHYFVVVRAKRNQQDLAIFLDFFLNKTSIPLKLVVATHLIGCLSAHIQRAFAE